ncbi:uncharacterized protein LOC143921085 isoform X2 [Arctopsyche grandis]
MMFIIRGVLNKHKFQAGIEIDAAKKFDDVVFLYEKEGRKFCKCLQAKHTMEWSEIDAMSLLTKDQSDFSLLKYFFSYKDLILENFFSGMVHENFILYTNYHLNINSVIGSKMIVSKNWMPFVSNEEFGSIKTIRDLMETRIESDEFLDIDDDNSPIRYRFNEKIVSILKSKANEYNLTRVAQALKDLLLGVKIFNQIEHVMKPYWKFLTEEVLDIDNGEFRKNFQKINKKNTSKVAQLFHLLLNEELDRKNKQKNNKKHGDNLPELSLDYLSQKVKEIKEYPAWEIDMKFEVNNVIKEEEIKEFLELFVFAASQPDYIQLKDIIKADILKDQIEKYGKDDFYTKRDINRYVDEVLQYFFTQISHWKVEKMKKNDKQIREKLMTEVDGLRFMTNNWEEVKIGVEDPVSSFLGRENELKVLHENIKRGPTVESQTMVIYGLPGMGKTELVRGYILQNSRRYENKILWIDAKSPETIEESFRNIADSLKIPAREDENGNLIEIETVVREVYGKFKLEKSLFIFDDAEDQETIDEFIPKEHVREGENLPFIIITSSNSRWKPEKSTYLNVLTERKAVQLIQNQTSITEFSQVKDIEELVNILGYFPLAIQQVSAYILKAIVYDSATGFDISKLVKNFSENAVDILEVQLPDSMSTYGKTTYTNFKIIIDAILQHELLGKKAFEILGMISYICPNHIDAEWFMIFFKCDDVGEIFQLLKDYSMIRIESGIVSTHNVVQLVTRIKLKQLNQEKVIFKKTLKFLIETIPENRYCMNGYNKLKILTPHIEMLASHCEKSSDSKRAKDLELLLDMLINCYNALVDPNKLKKVLERKLSLVKELYGVQHLEIGKVYICLASVEYFDFKKKTISMIYYEKGFSILENECIRVLHDKQGIFDLFFTSIGMEVLIEMARGNLILGYFQKTRLLFEMFLSFLSKVSIDDLNTCAYLTTFSCTLGKYTLAKELFEKCLELFERHSGKYNQSMATLYSNFGMLNFIVENFSLAKDMLEKSLAICLEYYGKNHTETMNAYEKLGNIYQRVDNFELAKINYEKCEVLVLKNYGEINCHTATIYMKLGIVNHKLGNTVLSKIFYDKCRMVYVQYYRKDPTQNVELFESLGDFEFSVGNYEKAKSHFQYCLKLCKKQYGEVNKKTAKAYMNLGNVNISLGNYLLAKDEYEKCLKVYLQLNQLSDENQIEILRILGEIDFQLGNYLLGKKQFELSLNLSSQYWGEEHFILIDTEMRIAIINIHLGNINLAKEQFEKCLAEYLNQNGEKHIKTATAHLNLGYCNLCLGNYALAKDHLKKSLDIHWKEYELGHQNIAELYFLLGQTETKSGNYILAKECYENCLQMYLHNYGDEHLKTAEVYGNLGIVNFMLGNGDLANEQYEKAIAIFFKYPEYKKHKNIAKIYENLAVCNHNIGNFDLARDWCEKSLSVYLLHYNDKHLEVVQVYNTLGCINFKLGNFKLAKYQYEKCLATYLKHYDTQQDSISSLQIDLGNVNYVLGNLTLAKDHYKKAANVYAKGNSEVSLITAENFYNLGNANVNLHVYAKAARCYNRAISIFKRHYGHWSLKNCTIILSLGRTYVKMGQNSKAHKIIKSAFTICLKAYDLLCLKVNQENKTKDYMELRSIVQGCLRECENIEKVESLQMAQISYCLGDIEAKLSNYGEALKLFNKALSMYEQYSGSNDFDTARALHSIGMVHMNLENFELAEKFLSMALPVYEEKLGREHSSTVGVMKNLANISENSHI